MPGEEHDFMRTIMRADEEVGALAPIELAAYFTGLGLSLADVVDWQRLKGQIGITEA